MHLPHIRPFAEVPLYFFTANTEERRTVLACQVVFDELTAIWRRSAEHDGWYVGRFMIMPDHVHFFASPSRGSCQRSVWHKMWKSVSSRTLTRELGVGRPFWQTDTFDHILRDKKSYSAKWIYVRENPVRKGLVANSDEWPWQGEICPLRFQ